MQSSTTTTTPSPSPSPLQSSVSSLQTSLHLLQTSIHTLHNGVQDFPRLSRVLETRRHFELSSEAHLVAAQAHVRADIQPEIERLLSAVERCVERMARREQSLIAQADLLAARLAGREGREGTESGEGVKVVRRTTTTTDEEQRVRREKMRLLRLRRDRVAYAVERLSLQAQQRERQLRRSMAVVG
ncbi:MAG: hypothetical protein M1826_000516 [Phylliscum demangeonii]|nr:MAG: hypothetical protein M1826_000516 [Phylliscum demangeonii]